MLSQVFPYKYHIALLEQCKHKHLEPLADVLHSFITKFEQPVSENSENSLRPIVL